MAHTVPPDGEICGIATEEQLWSAWIFLDFCLTAVISLTDVTTGICMLLCVISEHPDQTYAVFVLITHTHTHNLPCYDEHNELENR